MTDPTTSTPRLLVVLVHWNRPDDTVRCVASLRNTSYPALDIWVVDNASAPEALAELESNLQEARIVRSPTNLGYAGGFNLGLSAALAETRPDYLWLLNNDTTVAEDCPTRLIEASNRLGPALISPQIILSENHRVLWYAGGRLTWQLRSHHIGRDEENVGQYDSVRQVPWATGCSLFLSRQTLERVGPMDESYFLYLEDVDWCLQAARAGVPSYYVPQARVYHGVSRSVDLLDPRVVVYYAWRNYYRLALRHGNPLQKVAAVWDLATRLVKTAVKLTVMPSARADRSYLARSRALIDALRLRWGPAPPDLAAPMRASQGSRA